MRKVAWQALLILTIGGFAAAQVKRPARTPYTPKKLDEYTAYCALWRTDATFRSTVRVTNSLETAPIDATVTLYMADGTPYVLPTVHLAKSGVEAVDVNAALAQAPPSLQPHLSRFGSASVSYRHDWAGVVLASMSTLDTARSLEFMPPFLFPVKPAPTVPGSAPPTQAYDGLWWRYADSSAGFVALANATDKPVGIEVGVSGLKTPAGRSLVLAAHATTMVDLKDFFAGDPGRVGGIHIAYSGALGSVAATGGIEDATKGFSASMPLVWHVAPAGTAGPRQLAAAGVMVNQQDPLLNFPASVSFTPYAFFRNIAATPRMLHFVVYYMDGRTVKSLPLPDLALQPGEAREVSIADLMVKQPQIEAINVAFSYDGYWNDILAAVGSTDRTGNYVFPVVPGAAYKGGARTSQYWLAQGGFDTMYTVWNPEPDAQELVVTLQYGANGESYKLPLTLEPHASAMIDIGELIRTRQLDQDGKILPLDVRHGSLVVSTPADEPEDAIDVVVGMGIYNPTKATCGTVCLNCAGETDAEVDPFSVLLGVGDAQQLAFRYHISSGYQYDITRTSDWASNASQVLAVQTAGQGSPGLSSAVRPGAAVVSATDQVEVRQYFVGCGAFEPVCQMMAPSAEAPAKVTPEIDSITPSQVQAGLTGVTLALTGTGFGTSPIVNIEQLGSFPGTGGDDRSATIMINTTNPPFLGDYDVTVTANGQTTPIADAAELTIYYGCPSSISISSRTGWPLAAGVSQTSNYPAYLTGIGLETVMTLGNVFADYRGLNFSEVVVPVYSTCPAAANIPTCSGWGGFQVGVNQSNRTSYGYPIPALPIPGNSSFYDAHVLVSTSDLLAGQAPNYSCWYACTQTYVCADGTAIGSFAVTRTLTHSTINGTPVTKVTIAKDPI